MLSIVINHNERSTRINLLEIKQIFANFKSQLGKDHSDGKNYSENYNKSINNNVHDMKNYLENHKQLF